MNKGLGWKVIVIIGVLLIFVYGIFGVPSGASGSALSNALLQRIHLGLDLKGGTHLILQVQVNDAVNVDSDGAIESLKAGLKTAKVNYAEITKPDPVNHPEQIVIKGVPPDATSALRGLVSDRLPEYDASSGANNTWTVTMKPTALTDTKNRAVTQAIETIRNRIDALGVTEPVIEEHGLGQYQILVQLPGVDDSGRVKDILQSTAMLEIKQMLAGPYPSEQAALQDKGGVAPPDSILLSGQCADGS
jgi:preprotein translocase subunit SecD